jgi:hypothetical protein
MKWYASRETDEDLIAARDFIAADNEQSARVFWMRLLRLLTGWRNSRR